MRKILAYFAFCALALSCVRVEPELPVGPEPSDEVLADLSVCPSALEMEGGSKAVSPLDPSVENTIANLWILQYADDGRLVKQEYIDESYVSPSGIRPLERPVLSLSLQARLVRSQGSTIILIANMGGTHAEDAEWPSSSAFKWGEHGGGSLYDLGRKLFSCSLENYSGDHLFMTGITEIDVTDSGSAVPVNVMLSRLASKFSVSIKSTVAGLYSNVRLQMVNCPVKMSLFPEELPLAAGTDLVEYAPQQVCPAGTYLGTDSFSNFYFYSCENLCAEAGKQTFIRVLADKEGTPVSVDLPVSSHRTTFRNTNYSIQISLK
ncbi:MAG: hypothetical protein KBS67_00500 [Bacteroidales bacterium]|nr:hypothetical protein [Candidatus Cryptobacteroides equifaecalis]